MENAVRFWEKVCLMSYCCSRHHHLFPKGTLGLMSWLQNSFLPFSTNTKSQSVEQLRLLHHKYCLFRRKGATPESHYGNILIILCQNRDVASLPADRRPGLFVEEKRPLTEVLHPADLVSILKVPLGCVKPAQVWAVQPGDGESPGEPFGILWAPWPGSCVSPAGLCPTSLAPNRNCYTGLIAVRWPTFALCHSLLSIPKWHAAHLHGIPRI